MIDQRLTVGGSAVARHDFEEVVHPGKLKHLLHGRLRIQQAQSDGLLAKPVVGGLENRHERTQSTTVHMTDMGEIDFNFFESR